MEHCTVWWDHRHNVASDVTASNAMAEDLGNVFMIDIPGRELALRVAQAFKDELVALGFDVLVAVD